jgi:hypothetical protein
MGKVSIAFLTSYTLNNLGSRSVHNIRIERLWFDVTSGFGGKWKRLFQELELWDGLDVNNSSHIWLLHHLFLQSINDDAQDWAGAWNNHVVNIRGRATRSRSPIDMFYFGMLEEGLRGVELSGEDNEDIGEDNFEENLAGFGVDWEALDDPQIRNHHDEANVVEGGIDDDIAANPFELHEPATFSHVEVEEPNCPFSVEQVQFLDSQLASQGLWGSRSVEAYRLRWITGLEISKRMFM